MKTSHIPLRYLRQIFNHFNFICSTIRQGSQCQRNNKVIKIKIYPYLKKIIEGLQILKSCYGSL